ncbi:MAG: serine hydrolase [Negativicutes bacterium]
MKKFYLIYGLLALVLLVGLPLTGFAETKPLTAHGPVTPSSVIASTDPLSTLSLQPITLQSTCPLVGKFQGAVGVYAKNLKTGQVVTLNPDEIFAAASTIKVPVSIVVYRHFYEQADSVTRRVYDTGIELMMTISENDYFADFLDEIEEAIGSEKIREHFSKLGMKHTTIRDSKARDAFGYSNVTTARDMGLIFEQFYLGNLINSEKTAFMKNALANTIFLDELPRYMQDRRVLHKIGDLDDVMADVGIVEGPNGPVLISIFTETPLESDYASDYIAAMSACVYSRLTGEATAWKKPEAI